jgi:multicomponent Na+:H+ antiporter subunit D
MGRAVILTHQIPPLTIAVPLLVAAFLAAGRDFWPRRLTEILALGTSILDVILTGRLLQLSLAQPIVYWMGGWRPRGGVAIGISLVIDPMGAGAALLASLLVAAACVYSLKYFESVGTLFHVLILVFLAGMCGFSLSGDVFNLFVWFELMGAAAYALCGYKTEDPKPLQGALNFAVTNTVGAFLALTGVALLYGRTGALNMAQIGRAMSSPGHSSPDALALAAFAFITCGFFVKAAAVPFHFWLDDAHAVAPTPVCLLFSGVMVELGLYGALRVYWTVFAGPLGPHQPQLRGILMGFAVLTAVVGGVMCFAQRNLKRLLAFSTVSHVGIMMMGVALLKASALGAVAIYVLAHGAVKAALFCYGGILLHRFSSVDEMELHGQGRTMPVTGGLFALSALLLASLPPFGLFKGEALLSETAKPSGYGWITLVASLAAALTGGAVLRVAARVFLGWGEKRDTEGKKIKEKRETSGGRTRTPAVMSGTAAVLVFAAVAIGLVPQLKSGARKAAIDMADTAGYQSRVLDGTPLPASAPGRPPVETVEFVRGLATALAAVILAAAALFQRRLPRAASAASRYFSAAIDPLRKLHSGHIGDYIAWLTVGVAALGGLLTLAFR